MRENTDKWAIILGEDKPAEASPTTLEETVKNLLLGPTPGAYRSFLEVIEQNTLISDEFAEWPRDTRIMVLDLYERLQQFFTEVETILT